MTEHVNLSAQEDTVGITGFTTSSKGFECVLRARYSDFIVEELFDHKPVSITPLPALDERTSTVDYDKFGLEYGSSEAAEQAKSFCQSVIDSTNDNVSIVLPPTEQELATLLDPSLTPSYNEKDLRRAQHNAIRSFLPDCVSSDTINDVDFPTASGTVKRKAIRLFSKSALEKKKPFEKKRKGPRFDRRTTVWPTDRNSHLRFTLIKENTDTLNTLRILAKFIGVSPKIFKISGIKDKRAVTAQYVTGFKLPKETLIKANTMRNIRVSNFSYVKDSLELGKHSGNRFTLILRNLQAKDSTDIEEIVNDAVEQVKEKGFINYFGLQRFGTTAVQTQVLGGLLLSGNYLKFLKYFVCAESPYDTDETKRARLLFNDFENNVENLKLVLSAFQKSRNVHRNAYELETKVLSKLKDTPTDLFGAVLALGKGLFQLYIHAFQSLIFNKLATFRLETFGDVPVVGDFVLESGDVIDRDEAVDCGDDDVVNESQISSIPKIKVLTAEDLDKYTIADVVLPLVGEDSLIPEHLKQIVHQIFEEFSISLDFSSTNPLLIPRGSYRKVIVTPKIHNHKIVKFSNQTDVLVSSPMNEFKILTGENSEEVVDGTEGPHVGLVISFDLPSSSYATMFIRELSKQSSHRQEQVRIERKNTRGGDDIVDVKRG
ncbi:hypothetical protein GEMRC1_002912 [Eukaryota sp. GEM-RC1]